MAIQYANNHRDAAMSDIVSKLGSSGNTILKIFAGTPPSNCANTQEGTLLANINCAVIFGNVTTNSGSVTANTFVPLSNLAITGGTASYFRLYPSVPTTANAVVQGTVGTSGADLNLNTTTITAAQAVTITSFVLTATGA